MSRIQEVLAGSPADRAGIRPGMTVRQANGMPVTDIIEWKKILAHPNLLLTLEDESGALDTVRVLHPSGTEIGLVFESPTVDCLKQCKNNCIFCFVRQMPKGQRKTLYVRDDDYRLSLVFGSYVTLTNVEDEEWQRILREKISPIYVSVHTTNPELRTRIMGNPRAALVMHQLRELVDAGITVQTQLVLIPGINDGEELERSLRDLYGLYPGVESVAVVPVGLTGHRENLPEINGYDRLSARKVLDLVMPLAGKVRRKIGSSFVYAADEFFVLAEAAFPGAAYYDDFAQLENGVGLCRVFSDEFMGELRRHRRRLTGQRNVVWVAGESPYGLLSHLQRETNLRLGTSVDILCVRNGLFGGRVTVSGLLAGEDISRAIEASKLPAGTVFLIPEITLREGVLLDGMTWGELVNAFPQYILDSCPIDGAELLRRTLKHGGERQCVMLP